MSTPVRQPHASTVEEVARALDSDLERGLMASVASERLVRHGLNRPKPARRPEYLRLVLNQVLDPLVALLVAATVVSVLIGDTVEAAAIAAVLVLNAALGFWHELAAERAVIALSEAFTQSAIVMRDGIERKIPAEEVVPGDLLVVRAGERVAADARIVEARSLEVDESALTGESLPVSKQASPVAHEAPVAERFSMLYAGTGLTRGHCCALVCATGTATELGQIEALTAAAKPPPTPLERRLARLTQQMVVAGILLTVALTGVMVLQGEPLHSAFLVGVAVAVAAVPEGLAATVTASLALGARSLAGRGAIVRRLDAITTLGETTMICTDKTGTLTENEMRVAALRPADGVDEVRLLEAAALASEAKAIGDGGIGDPVEVALMLAAMERGIAPVELLKGRAPVHEIPFDSDRKRMTVVYDGPDCRRAYCKGAPEVVAEHASAPDPSLVELAEAWASEGFRVLAVATRSLDPTTALDDTLETELELLGLIALYDPLRPTAATSINRARIAGISVKMLTGDHPATARTIGHAIGLADTDIVARATPGSKLALVEELQTRGEVVAVTGDGVNDAPALRRANVGVAMGRSGTEAAREAAAIVLTDDDFATILTAIQAGRRIGDNIRKFIAFLLSANFGEVLVFAVAIIAGLGPPLAVVQVLLVNLVTDGLPALALGQDPPSIETMRSAPRHGARLFDRTQWLVLTLIGVLVGSVALAAFATGRATEPAAAQTMAYATIALAELMLVFGIRSPSLAAWRSPPNGWLVSSTLGAALFVALSIYLPPAHELFATVSLSASQVALVVVLAVLPLIVIEVVKALGRRLSTRSPVSLPSGTTFQQASRHV
jgi:P-type Ca2+ transporter type 2C